MKPVLCSSNISKISSVCRLMSSSPSSGGALCLRTGNRREGGGKTERVTEKSEIGNCAINQDRIEE